MILNKKILISTTTIIILGFAVFYGINSTALKSLSILQNVNADIPMCELLQLRISLEGTATTTPQFKSLILR